MFNENKFLKEIHNSDTTIPSISETMAMIRREVEWRRRNKLRESVWLWNLGGTYVKVYISRLKKLYY